MLTDIFGGLSHHAERCRGALSPETSVNRPLNRKVRPYTRPAVSLSSDAAQRSLLGRKRSFFKGKVVTIIGPLNITEDGYTGAIRVESYYYPGKWGGFS